MNTERLLGRLREEMSAPLPLPGHGETGVRHRRLMAIGREDLSLARLFEAHADAVAILAESGRTIEPNVLYGVWASEKPGQALQLDSTGGRRTVSGSKMFCSGAPLVDRALLTVSLPEQRLIDLDLRGNASRVTFDYSDWKTSAFAETRTATVTCDGGRCRVVFDAPGFLAWSLWTGCLLGGGRSGIGGLCGRAISVRSTYAGAPGSDVGGGVGISRLSGCCGT